MIYLASPYTHSDVHVREWRFREACRAAATLLRSGITVFSPIAHSHPIAAFGMPTSWEFWSQVDREFLSRCDTLAVLTLPGWRESVGVQAEINMAIEMHLPVVFVEPAALEEEDREPPTIYELLQLRACTKQQAA